MSDSLPEVVVIYLPGDGRAHITGANRRADGTWGYSEWSFMPAREVNGFVDAGRQGGMIVLNVRSLAKLHKPGMERAVPILLRRPDVTVQDATDAFKRLHRSILEMTEDEAK